MSKFTNALRRAVATFIFAAGGVLLVGPAIFDIDVATWKLAASVGLGSVANLVYRWAESALKEGEY